jgi:hypothetical protein
MKYIVLIFFSLLIFAGCDLFNTRNAEIPNQSRSNYQLAVTPDLLIENLINSMQDLNLQNYLSCFSDTTFGGKTFVFSPSSGAASQYPSFATGWKKGNESEYFTNLIPLVNTSLQVTLLLTTPIKSQQGDSIFYSASYTLNIPFKDSNIPSTYEGDLKFTMIWDSRSWSIYYWQDIKSTQNPSWSELKGRLY